jgi:hypothetical protein
MKAIHGFRAISVAAGLLLFLSAGWAAPADTPEQFLAQLYSQYAPGKKPIAFVFPDAAPIADASMLALLRRDRDKSKGEVGALDSDPICNCQDWERLELVSVHIVSQTSDRAVANVIFRDSMAGGRERQTARFELVRVKGAWKIHDIGTKDTPSLQTMLRTYKY